uniref:PBPb domain-containing protein n=1 Tax=Meloidogyne floridensis TaxID=298350 RepID=A0A915NQN4_9BILA
MNNISSEKIRVVFARNPPDAFPTCNTFPTLVPNIKCPFPVNWGHQFDPNSEDAEKAFTPNYGLQERGNWTGILGLLEAGLADTVCTLYPYTEQKAKFFNFSHPITGVRDIYIAKPKRKSLSVALWNAFFPYERSLWFLLLFFLLLQCGVASLVANMEYRLNLRPTYNPLEKMWQYLRLQIHQATEFQTPFFLQSGNLAFIFYALIQATLFTQLYTAVLLSSFFEMLNFTRMSHLRNLASALDTNPIRVVDNVSVALDFVERAIQKNQAFIRRTYDKVRDIYIAKPRRKSLSVALWNAFFPYERSLWFLLLFFLLLQCGVASLVANMEYRLNLRPTYNPLEKMWQYLRLQIHQATEFQTPFFLQSGNLAFIFYALIQATLFTQLYTAVLLSSLIRGENPRPWENYNEMIRLVKANEYTLVMDKHHLEKDNRLLKFIEI